MRDSVVELYGKLYPELIREYGKDPTPAGTAVATLAGAPTGTKSIITRNEMESSNSRFGVRGYEKLGGGLKAIFQLETVFLVDSNTSAFAQRDSFVGLTHDRWGTVKLGRMDTPFKSYGDDLSFLGVSSGNFVSTSNLLRKPGFGTNSASSFHLRRANVVQYESPIVGGFDGSVQYSTDETDTATRHPHVWSGAREVGRRPVQRWPRRARDPLGSLRRLAQRADGAIELQRPVGERQGQGDPGDDPVRTSACTRFEADYIQKKYDENATVTGRFLELQEQRLGGRSGTRAGTRSGAPRSSTSSPTRARARA